MIRKVSRHGVGYSVVDLEGVSHVFAAAVPREGSRLEEEARDALRTIEAVFREEGDRDSIVAQTVFLRDPAELEACRSILKDFYGRAMPATTYVAQPPCEGRLLSLEALGIGKGEDAVVIERVDERTVVARHGGVSWIHVAHATPSTSDPRLYARTLSAFREVAERLRSLGVGFDRVVRSWLYLGDIVGLEDGLQRYHELNRARTDFYRGVDFARALGLRSPGDRAYPASTGIGTGGRDVVVSSIAVSAEPGRIAFLPLENPLQTSACDYAGRYGRESPKFSRAMAVVGSSSVTIFVSGTASITGSETRWFGDVERQTHQTLDNIEELVSEANFARHGRPGIGAKLGDLALARVYLKRPEDYGRARAVCEARLGELPTAYAVADVCRPDLLVEIEGIAFAKAPGG